MMGNLDITTLQNGHSSKFKGFDYIEFYVGNAWQAAHFYRMAFGFTPIAYAGLETGVRDRTSFIIEQRNIRFILTSSMGPNHPIADHVKRHGDGVKDIALAVEDATEAYEQALKRGARSVMEPTVIEEDEGHLTKATISVYGDTEHSFIQREGHFSAYLPNYRLIGKKFSVPTIGLAAIDHIAIGVEQGKLDEWVDFYKNAFGFHQSHQEDVSTEYSAMNSKVVQDSTGRIKFPIMEPVTGNRRSQIEEYIAYYQGPGAQHVAMLTGDIIESVKSLRSTGVDFLKTPETYYDRLEDRVGKFGEDMTSLREQNILVDRDNWGYLMQIFTKPVQSRPTVFMEMIQRNGARGFGGGNIKALFEAIERDQMLRGNI